MKKIAILIIFILASCERKLNSIHVNEFLSEKTIDTTKYNTYDELFLNGKINRITSNSQENRFINIPLVSENKFIYIERKHSSDNEKIVFFKINNNGETLDSLIINRYVTIINDYIIDKNTYCSWFVDNDKNIKKLENVNFFLKSDTTKIKSLVKNFKKNNLEFYSTSGYTNNNTIDTCNYIISFKKSKLVKYNFLSTIHPEYDLQIESLISSKFSTKFRDLESINSEDLFKVDNFYAYSFEKASRGGALFSNTGASSSSCSYYNGTYFVTLLNQSNLKLKLMNMQICKNKSIYDFAKQEDVYSEGFLNFYLITNNVDYFYVVKK